MARFLVLALIIGTAMAAVGYATVLRWQDQVALTYGDATISLGMTVDEVEQRLAESGRHIQFLPDKNTSLVWRNGPSGVAEGQIIFKNSRVVSADYHMTNVSRAEDLTQEIAQAVETMKSATCVPSNSSSRGTAGGFSKVSFDCGSKKFDIQTVQDPRTAERSVNVNIRIAQTSER